MGRLFLPGAILFCAVSGLQAEDDPALRQMLDSALPQIRPFAAASEPYVLESEITIQDKIATQGHYTIIWRDESHWWSKVEVAGFGQITIRDGEIQYIRRNLPYTPQPIADLQYLFDPDEAVLQLVPEKISTSNEKQASETCLRTHDKAAEDSAQELCEDPESHDLRKATSFSYKGAKHTREFRNYFEFNGRRYPRQLDLFVNDQRVVSVTVSSLVSKPFVAALLVPPMGPIERRKCADMKQPVPLYQPSLDLGRPVHGAVDIQIILSATVLLDGSVTDVNIVQAGAEYMITPSIDAVKRYKFKPAMCGRDPVVSDVMIEMDLRVY